MTHHWHFNVAQGAPLLLERPGFSTSNYSSFLPYQVFHHSIRNLQHLLLLQTSSS
jgi:hypothetical protein